MSMLVGVAAIVILTLATGFFVAQEFAYVAADRGALRQSARRGDRAAARALDICERLSFTLSGAQLGITVTALLAGYVAEPYLGEGLARLLGLTGLPEAVTATLAMALALLVVAVVQMVFGELAPKNWAIARPEALARALSGPTAAYLTVAGPLIRLFDAAANRLLRRTGVEPVEELRQGATVEELDHIVAESYRDGRLDRVVARSLRRGLAFRRLVAAQAMVPRVAVRTVAAHDPATRVVELLDTGHARFPVLDVDGELAGVVGAADVLAVPAADRAVRLVRELARPPLVLPGSLPLVGALERLRRERRQLACVVDEYGDFAGVLTLEDVAEELVGAMRDEDDPVEMTVTPGADGSWTVPGGWRVDEVAHATGMRPPAHAHYETVAGLVISALGRLPTVGDAVTVAVEPSTSEGTARLRARVLAVRHRVPALVELVSESEDA